MRIHMHKKHKALILVFDNQAEVLQMLQDLTQGCAKLPLKDYPLGFLLPQAGCTLRMLEKVQLVNEVLHPKDGDTKEYGDLR